MQKYEKLEKIGEGKCQNYTVPERKVLNPCFGQTEIPLYLTNHWNYQNIQYTIEKSYKMVTRNAKKKLEIFKMW